MTADLEPLGKHRAEDVPEAAGLALLLAVIAVLSLLVVLVV